jgi:hypothetical protein
MTPDWAADVKRYVPNADESAIKGIIKHCGIALQSTVGSFVSEDEGQRDAFAGAG